VALLLVLTYSKQVKYKHMLIYIHIYIYIDIYTYIVCMVCVASLLTSEPCAIFLKVRVVCQCVIL
jgi:hypothetical protein